MDNNIIDKEMTEEEIKNTIEQNEFLKVNLRLMNGLNLIQKEEELEPDYNKLYENISLNKRIETAVKYSPESAAYYYGLISNRI